MLGLGFGLGIKAIIFGLGYGLAARGLGLVPRGLVNITALWLERQTNCRGFGGWKQSDQNLKTKTVEINAKIKTKTNSSRPRPRAVLTPTSSS